jgi:uracil DNA glycosylase
VLEFNSYIGSGFKALADKINGEYSEEHGRIVKVLWAGEAEFFLDEIHNKDWWILTRANITAPASMILLTSKSD